MLSLGIVQPNQAHVAGTVDEKEATRVVQANSTLRHDPTDPNDPLNWSMRERDAILFILTMVSVLATTAAPLLAADSVRLAIFFPCTFEHAAWLTAFHLLGVAVGAVICVPSARVWGKRHVFLLGALLMTVSSAWGGSVHNTKNYYSLFWARIFQGVALAPFESLINAVVGDLYLVEDRNWRVAFVNTSIFGGAFLTPVFVGMIAKTMGWQWSFYLLSIFMGIGTLILFFAVPETAYRRPETLQGNAATVSTDATMSVAMKSMPERSPAESLDSDEARLRDSPQSKSPMRSQRAPYTQRLRIFTGRKTNDLFLLLLLRPFPLYLQPAVFWGCLMQGVIIGWTVMVGVILALVFLAPPLFFTEEQTGKLYTSAFIGAIVGLLLSGLYNEYVTKWLLRRNNKVYEPEFRIFLAIPTLIFTSIGLYGFGITAADVKKYGWLIPDVFIGFVVAGMVMGAITSAQYLLDAHQDIDIEIFTNLIIFKNMFSFILAYFAYSWIFKSGITYMFNIFASIEVVICCLSIPMYVFGKCNRAFFQKHDLLKICKLR